MGLFTRTEQKGPIGPRKADGPIPLHILHKQECRACPLNEAVVASPKMLATGAKNPYIYVLGEAPGEEEDAQGKQFIGKSGQLLRSAFSSTELREIRFNNVIRTRPPGNRTPEQREIECCRPSIIRDIEESKPKAIFGFGGIPLNWALGQNMISNWRGRMVPVRIGTHVCWYFPMLHPSYVLRAEHAQDADDSLGPEWRATFLRDIRNAYSRLERAGEPYVVSHDEAKLNVEILEGLPGDEFKVCDFLRSVADQPSAVDWETTAVRPYTVGSKLITAAVSIGSRTLAFPVLHSKAKWGDSGRVIVKAALSEYLRRPKALRIAHNAPFEMEWSAHSIDLAIPLAVRWHCTMVGAYVLDERAGGQSLDAVTQLNFGLKLKDVQKVNYGDDVGGLMRANLESENLRNVLLYNAYDAKYCYLNWEVQQKQIDAQGLRAIYELQLDRLPTVVHAQLEGMPVDQAEVEIKRKQYEEKSKKLLDEIQNRPEVEKYRQNYGLYNPTSPKDIATMFDVVLGCKEVKRRDGSITTDEKALSKISHPLAKLTLSLRQVDKVISTYIDPLDRRKKGSEVYPDGMLHTSFRTTFTATGRTSSDGPNMQNFPKRKNAEVRSMIAPPPGHVIIAADYGQIEARVIAMASKDKYLCKALWEDFDVHMFWADWLIKEDSGILDIWGTKKNLRSEVKNKVVFPAFYGSEAAPIARNIKIKDSLSQKFFKQFWEMFADIPPWQQDLIKRYRDTGFVECLTGRRRRAPLNDNMIINSPIQGTASDIVVDAMNRLCWRSFEEQRREIRPRLNIHDDLTFISPEEKAEDAIVTIVEEMVKVPFDFINVPISIEVSVGKNWYEMEEIGKFASNKLVA